nr:MAG TPA: Poly(ADP-ribose) glycohydrolase [Caudoviricetes sp.]
MGNWDCGVFCAGAWFGIMVMALIVGGRDE